MYYRKLEDNKRHAKRKHRSWLGWWFNNELGYYQYCKKNSRQQQFYKKYSNKVIRHNKNDYYIGKSNQCHKEFEYWWTIL